MTWTRPLAYVLANFAALVALASASGRLGAAAGSVALMNLYIVFARRFFSPGQQVPGEEELQVLSAVALALRRGRPLPQAMAAGAAAAGSQLAPTMNELTRNLGLGMSADEALARAASAPAAGWTPAMFWAVLFGSRTGVPLDGLLERLAKGVLQQADLERQFQVLALNSRLSALALSALPVGLLAIFLPFKHDLLLSAVGTPWGRCVLVALTACWAIGLWLIFRVGGRRWGCNSSPLDELEAHLPVLMELMAEGLQLGLEPRGLLERLQRTSPPGRLKCALERVLGQTLLGLTLEEALRHEATAGETGPFRGFARMLAEAGVSPAAAPVLRLHAQELRSRRHYRLSLEVQRAPFLLVLALVFLVFPLTFGLLLLPFAAKVASVLR